MLCFLAFFVIFQYGVPGQVWSLIVSIPDLAFPSTFYNLSVKFGHAICIVLFLFAICYTYYTVCFVFGV